MTEKFKKHEVDRLLNVMVVLGWELKEEKYDDTGITVVLRRDLPPALLKVSNELDLKSSSK